MTVLFHPGMTLCFTGRSNNQTRFDIETTARRAGFHVTAKASQADVLVVGMQANANKPSTKLQTARARGIPCADTATFLHAAKLLINHPQPTPQPNNAEPVQEPDPMPPRPSDPNAVIAQWDAPLSSFQCSI